ncbi:paramyosin, short form-like [Achroia grisella]|uniref:paramyosin, short form-like n=1 Tax=Achroia grisella TaxID=688607 RepID=UPI0027D2F6C6|nr:paramyosin, short form-like [Achroia grisella]
MAPVKVPNYSKWTRPPTAVYEDNYGYGINYYQPMIDYISAKENGAPRRLPHIPWNNERGLDKYKCNKVQTYTDQEVAKISREVAAQAKRDLNSFNSFEVTKRTPLSVVATAAAANVTKHVGIESVSTKTKKKRGEKIKAERQKKRMEEIEKELQLYEAEANVGAELRSKALMYRGKSAGAIAQVLLDESRKNVAEGKFRNLDSDIKKRVDRNYAALSKKIAIEALEESLSSKLENKISETVSETIRTVREVSPTTCIVRIKTETPVIVDNSYLITLQELKETLKEFESLNTNVIIDRRYKNLSNRMAFIPIKYYL